MSVNCCWAKSETPIRARLPPGVHLRPNVVLVEEEACGGNLEQEFVVRDLNVILRRNEIRLCLSR